MPPRAWRFAIRNGGSSRRGGIDGRSAPAGLPLRENSPMRKQRGRREDSSLRWAFKYVYRREPTKAELEAYAWDRHIERLRSFPRHWLDADDIADLAAADAAAAKAAPPAERPPTPVP